MGKGEGKEGWEKRKEREGRRGLSGGERKREAFIQVARHVTLMHAGNWDCRSETEGTVEVL